MRPMTWLRSHRRDLQGWSAYLLLVLGLYLLFGSKGIGLAAILTGSAIMASMIIKPMR